MAWSARILALAMCVFLGVFALDAWDPGKRFLERLADVAIHLVPSGVVLAIVIAAWHKPWIGGVAFLALAIAYALMVNFRIDWVLAISGPLFVIGLLYLWSWQTHRSTAAG